MSAPEPTGRWRHRLKPNWGFEPVLVLQIEERLLCTEWHGGLIDAQWRTRWRDAALTDLTETNVKPARLK